MNDESICTHVGRQRKEGGGGAAAVKDEDMGSTVQKETLMNMQVLNGLLRMVEGRGGVNLWNVY